MAGSRAQKRDDWPVACLIAGRGFADAADRRDLVAIDGPPDALYELPRARPHDDLGFGLVHHVEAARQSDHRKSSGMNNRLKILRAERNWSQADLAGRLEVSRQSVNAIETGALHHFEIGARFL